MGKENIRVELCDFDNREHTGRFTELLNHYMEDPMGDCCKVTLEVRFDNYPAQKLYKNCGFILCEPDMHFWTKILQ